MRRMAHVNRVLNHAVTKLMFRSLTWRGPVLRHCSTLLKPPGADLASLKPLDPPPLEQLVEDPDVFMEALQPTSDMIFQILMEEDQIEDTHNGLRRRASLAKLTIPPLESLTESEELMRCLDIAGAKGDVEAAEEILAEIEARGIPMDIFNWTRALGAPATAGDRDAAFSMIQRMAESGIRGSAQSNTQLLRACCVGGDLDSAFRIFDILRDAGNADVVMYTVMLDGLFRHGENEEGWGMLREMHQNGIELDTVALTVLMRGCIDKQQVEKALGFMEEMLDSDNQPSKVTYNTLITVCATRGDTFGKAVEWFNRMEAEGFSRDAHSYRAIQRACATAGEVRYMERVLQEAEQVEIDRDITSFTLEAKTYATAIKLKGRHDHKHAGYCIDRANTLIARMDELELQPQESTLRALLQLFSEAPRPQRALNLLQDRKWEDSICGWPDLWGCNMVISSFTKVRHMEQAFEMLDWMESKGIEPDTYTWKALLHGALKKKQTVAPLVEVLRRMQAKGLGMEQAEGERVRQRLESVLGSDEMQK